MMQMLGALLGIVMTLVLGTANHGKPESTPPVGQGEETGIGNQVSEEAKNLNFENRGQNPEGEQNQEQEENQNGLTTQTKPDTTKIPAFNNKAEKEMPTLIPQVAVDKSPALDELTQTDNGEETNGEGTESQDNQSNQNNAQFGLEISGNQPGEAKEDGYAFGRETSENAINNGNRP